MNLPSRRLAAERNAIRVCLFIAVAFVMLGVSEFWINSTRSFHGRWGWLREFLFDNFGTAGVAAMWFMFAAAPCCSHVPFGGMQAGFQVTGGIGTDRILRRV
jgi:hypothetical protein